jgi:hypothetical protein
MKIITSLYLFLLLLPFTAIAQDPCVGTIALSRQSQVDSFRVYYPACTWISGNLIIRPETGAETNINDLRPLLGINRISGNLIIESSPHLKNLHGLDSIKNVGGEFRLSHCRSLKNTQGLNSLEFVNFDFSINDNDSLETLQGLERLRTLNQSLRCNRNPLLVNFDALKELKIIQSYMEITENANLKNLHGLQSIREVSGNIIIRFNPSLASVSGLDSLVRAGSVILTFCPSLKNLEGLQMLETIQSWLTLERNDDLMSLAGLESLQSIGFGIQLIDNSKLSDILPLSSVNIDSLTILRIQRNQLLSVCHLPNLCNYLSREGDASIFLNAQGCRSMEEVIDNCETVSTSEKNIDPIIQIYPNPSKYQLWIDPKIKKIDQFEYAIMDSSGRLCLLGKNSITEPIDISTLLSGIYILQVQSAIYSKQFKFIKL